MADWLDACRSCYGLKDCVSCPIWQREVKGEEIKDNEKKDA